MLESLVSEREALALRWVDADAHDRKLEAHDLGLRIADVEASILRIAGAHRFSQMQDRWALQDEANWHSIWDPRPDICVTCKNEAPQG
jgi:hypothetical protein